VSRKNVSSTVASSLVPQMLPIPMKSPGHSEMMSPGVPT
jgi:hypothetical protein